MIKHSMLMQICTSAPSNGIKSFRGIIPQAVIIFSRMFRALRKNPPTYSSLLVKKNSWRTPIEALMRNRTT